MDRSRTPQAVLLLLAVAGVLAFQTRTQSRVDRLALRVDSLAISLGEVIQAINSSRPQPMPDSLEAAGIGPALGAKTAPVTMIEFIDYECPFCRRFHAETLPLLIEDYVDSGRLRIVVRDLPLPIHPNAMIAARAGRCADELDTDRYWAFAGAVLGANEPPTLEVVERIARDTDFDATAFADCARSDRHDAAIEEDVRVARELGISGTPAFIIGSTTQDGTIRGRAIRGAYPIEIFRRVIDAALDAVPDA